jgi:hypothetical protein
MVQLSLDSSCNDNLFFNFFIYKIFYKTVCSEALQAKML